MKSYKALAVISSLLVLGGCAVLPPDPAYYPRAGAVYGDAAQYACAPAPGYAAPPVYFVCFRAMK